MTISKLVQDIKDSDIIKKINEIIDNMGGGNLSDLSDVNLTSPSNGQSLVYDNTSGKWVNQTKYAMVITDYTT